MRCVLFLIVLFCGAAAVSAAEVPPTAVEVKAAIACMRKIDPAALTDKQKETKAQELDAAAATLQKAGVQGVAAIKNELQKIAAVPEKDDLFKLYSAVILWEIGKAAEASTIADIWSGDVNLAANYNYVFFTAFAAARTQEPRVLPMLTAILRDQKGSAFIAQHCMPVSWPLSHRFVWGVYGAQGDPALLQVLDKPCDAVSQASAIVLLMRAQCVEGLDKIRAVAQHGAGDARSAAIRALGVFGHPQDFDGLLAGLQSQDPAEAWEFAYALYEYEDLRAVPGLIARLNTGDQRLAGEVAAALSHLPTPAGFAALHDYAATAKNQQIARICAQHLAAALRPLHLDDAAFAAKPAGERAMLLVQLRELREAPYRLQASDRKLTHAELLLAAAEWKKRHRIPGGTYAWVQERHVIAAATAADIPLLLDVAAACYGRLSDECLSETQTLEKIVQYLVQVSHILGQYFEPSAATSGVV